MCTASCSGTICSAGKRSVRIGLQKLHMREGSFRGLRCTCFRELAVVCLQWMDGSSAVLGSGIKRVDFQEYGRLVEVHQLRVTEAKPARWPTPIYCRRRDDLLQACRGRGQNPPCRCQMTYSRSRCWPGHSRTLHCRRYFNAVVAGVLGSGTKPMTRGHTSRHKQQPASQPAAALSSTHYSASTGVMQSRYNVVTATPPPLGSRLGGYGSPHGYN
jgi:hypothetical protein